MTSLDFDVQVRGRLHKIYWSGRGFFVYPGHGPGTGIIVELEDKRTDENGRFLNPAIRKARNTIIELIRKQEYGREVVA